MCGDEKQGTRRVLATCDKYLIIFSVESFNPEVFYAILIKQLLYIYASTASLVIKSFGLTWLDFYLCLQIDANSNATLLKYTVIYFLKFYMFIR